MSDNERKTPSIDRVLKNLDYHATASGSPDNSIAGESAAVIRALQRELRRGAEGTRDSKERPLGKTATQVKPMTEDQLRVLWYGLDKVKLLTGAWSDMSIADVPPEVWEEFKQAVMDAEALCDMVAEVYGR